MENKERLQKYLAHSGIASRRTCEQMILGGLVKVNNKIVTELGTKINISKDKVEVKGKLIKSEEKRTFIFYKPKGVITSMSDPLKRRTVSSYFRFIDERVYPVGRLDYSTSGLLLMTNDGELSNKLMHPKFKIPKKYLVKVTGLVNEKQISKLRKGIRLEDGVTLPSEVDLINVTRSDSVFEMTIYEGRNRQIRRMCEAIGHKVLSLKRIKFAFLELGNLKQGQIKELSSSEIKRLESLK